MYSLSFLILELENARTALLHVFEVSNGTPNRAGHSSHLRIGCAESGSLSERSGFKRRLVRTWGSISGAPAHQIPNYRTGSFSTSGGSAEPGVLILPESNEFTSRWQ